MASRLQDNVSRGAAVDLVIDGQPVTAFEGETIAAVLLLQDKTVCYRTRGDQPRMMFCNMGSCFECRVLIERDGVSRWVLACNTPVQSQMAITTDIDLSRYLADGSDDV